MKLLASPAESPVTTGLYMTIKQSLAALESSGHLSFLCLQAMTLVAAYEYGHAIYPAAWMTIGACSRYAAILGLSIGRSRLNIVATVLNAHF